MTARKRAEAVTAELTKNRYDDVSLCPHQPAGARAIYWRNCKSCTADAIERAIEADRADRVVSDIHGADLLQGCAVIRCSHCGCPSVQEPGHNYCQTCARSVHTCPISAQYGDDGEMQCGACLVDFKRDSIGTLEAHVKAKRLNAGALAYHFMQGFKHRLPHVYDDHGHPRYVCECGTVDGLHEFGRHRQCEYFNHHCDSCHERGACTAHDDEACPDCKHFGEHGAECRWLKTP